MENATKKPALGIVGSIICLLISLFLLQDACLSGSDARMVLSLLLSLFFFALAIHAYVQRRRKYKISDDFTSPQIRIAENPQLGDNDTPVGIA